METLCLLSSSYWAISCTVHQMPVRPAMSATCWCCTLPSTKTLFQQLYCARRNSALIDKVELDLSTVDCIPLSKQNLGLEDLAVLLEYDDRVSIICS